MAEFKVIEIIDPTTVKVEPPWVLKNKDGVRLSKGTLVMISGYNEPVRGSTNYVDTTRKLKALTMGRIVELKQPALVPGSENEPVLNCRVFVNGVEVSDFFPDLKVRKPGFSS